MKPDIRPDIKKGGYPASQISGTTLIKTFEVTTNCQLANATVFDIFPEIIPYLMILYVQEIECIWNIGH